MKVLVACECSGVVREAFRSRGHDAWSCDILPSSDGSHNHHMGPVEDILGDGWELMIAHPPCTALSVTGNRHYADTPLRFAALELVKLLLDAPIEKVCVENPVGVISSLIRKPDQYIQPFEHGHKVTKKTGLWLRGLPLLQPTKVVDVPPPVTFPSGKRMSQWFYDTSLLPQKDRAGARSVTFQGIADAMAEQWG